MSIITRTKNTEEYLKRISSEPKRTIENKKLAISNFTNFCKEILDETPEQICSELLIIKKRDEEKYLDALYDTLQEWINWNVKNKLGAYTLQVRFSNLRSYLYFLGIKTDNQDVKQLLTFPKRAKEERYPLTTSELRMLVEANPRNPMRQALYLACSSSGIRIGEALAIRKSDLDFTKK